MRDYLREGRVTESSIPMDQFPLPHRGMIWLGLSMLVFWILLEVTIPVANPLAHPVAQDAEILSGVLLIFGLMFGAFGVGCELVIAVFSLQRSTNHERDRLEELSGCSSSNRRHVKVHKRVCVSSEELTQIKALLEELRSR